MVRRISKGRPSKREVRLGLASSMEPVSESPSTLGLRGIESSEPIASIDIDSQGGPGWGQSVHAEAKVMDNPQWYLRYVSDAECKNN